MLWRKNPHIAHNDDNFDAKQVLSESTPFAAREAYRTVYTNVRYLPIESRCRKLVVTSAFSGEGKTMLSSNLSIMLAENEDNKKILVVDGDMRSPRLARLLAPGIDPHTHGLSEFLAGIDEKPNVTETSTPHLYAIFSGKRTANPSGLLNSGRMREFLAYCEENFDYVIFDTPPVTIVADALQLSSSVDGYLLAVRADYSDVDSLRDTVKAIERVDGKILGMILSAVEPKRGSGYGYGHYGKYGKYGKYGRYGYYGRYGAYDTRTEGYGEEPEKTKTPE